MVTQTILRGVVRGKTIELDDATGLSEGQQVVIAVQTIESQKTHVPDKVSPGPSPTKPAPTAEEQKPHVPGDGIRRSAGAWADAGEELDDWLEWNRQQRKQSRPEIEP